MRKAACRWRVASAMALQRATGDARPRGGGGGGVLLAVAAAVVAALVVYDSNAAPAAAPAAVPGSWGMAETRSRAVPPSATPLPAPAVAAGNSSGNDTASVPCPPLQDDITRESSRRRAAVATLCNWVASHGGVCTGVATVCEEAGGCYLVAAHVVPPGTTLLYVPRNLSTSAATAMLHGGARDVIRLAYGTWQQAALPPSPPPTAHGRNDAAPPVAPPAVTRRVPYLPASRTYRGTWDDDCAGRQMLAHALFVHYEAFVTPSSFFAPLWASLPEPPGYAWHRAVVALAGGIMPPKAASAAVADVDADRRLLRLAGEVPEVAAALPALRDAASATEMMLLQDVFCRFPAVYRTSDACLLRCKQREEDGTATADDCRALAARLRVVHAPSLPDGEQPDAPPAPPAGAPDIDVTYHRWLVEVRWVLRTLRTRAHAVVGSVAGGTLVPLVDMMNHQLVGGRPAMPVITNDTLHAPLPARAATATDGELAACAPGRRQPAAPPHRRQPDGTGYTSPHDRALAPGEEVATLYATSLPDICSYRLFVGYGFVPFNTPASECAIVSVRVSDAAVAGVPHLAALVASLVRDTTGGHGGEAPVQPDGSRVWHLDVTVDRGTAAVSQELMALTRLAVLAEQPAAVAHCAAQRAAAPAGSDAYCEPAVEPMSWDHEAAALQAAAAALADGIQAREAAERIIEQSPAVACLLRPTMRGCVTDVADDANGANGANGADDTDDTDDAPDVRDGFQLPPGDGDADCVSRLPRDVAAAELAAAGCNLINVNRAARRALRHHAALVDAALAHLAEAVAAAGGRAEP